MSHSTTVRTRLELKLVVPGGPSLPVLAELHYTVADPWAVRVAFQTGAADEEVVEWLFARSLLGDGVAVEVGCGDVRVRPVDDDGTRTVQMEMSSPSGSALFEFRRDDVVEFLQQTYLLVPTGAELGQVDLDAEISALLD